MQPITHLQVYILNTDMFIVIGWKMGCATPEHNWIYNMEIS